MDGVDIFVLKMESVGMVKLFIAVLHFRIFSLRAPISFLLPPPSPLTSLTSTLSLFSFHYHHLSATAANGKLSREKRAQL